VYTDPLLDEIEREPSRLLKKDLAAIKKRKRLAKIDKNPLEETIEIVNVEVTDNLELDEILDQAHDEIKNIEKTAEKKKSENGVAASIQLYTKCTDESSRRMIKLLTIPKKWKGYDINYKRHQIIRNAERDETRP
jgi:hypothetical protein